MRNHFTLIVQNLLSQQINLNIAGNIGKGFNLEVRPHFFRYSCNPCLNKNFIKFQNFNNMLFQKIFFKFSACQIFHQGPMSSNYFIKTSFTTTCIQSIYKCSPKYHKFIIKMEGHYCACHLYIGRATVSGLLEL